MKNIFLVVAILLGSQISIAQTQDSEQLIQAPKAFEEAPQEETFVIVEKMPEFPGGQAALMH
ncbi:MAG: hypothetical protein ACOVLD_07590, partial [Bacteroidia bacterium]